MQTAQREKKSKKLEKHKASSEKKGESSQNASLPTTIPATPGKMPPPSPSYPSQQQGPSKVAIPRLRRDSDGHSISATSGGEHNRVTHACEPCRHRKTKCSGERPKCKHCEDFKLQCVYVDGKRDRARKELGSMAEKLEEYERLLKEISLHVDGSTKQRITNALERESSPVLDEVAESPTSPDQSHFHSARKSRVMDEPTGPYGEDRFNARAGSMESVDKIDEDFNRDAAARATGYHGKNSEITWMHRLRQRTEQDQDQEEQQDNDSTYATTAGRGSSNQATRTSSGLTSISDSTYHCDDLSLSITDLQVKKYEMPPEHIADTLLKCYFNTVHPTFPIVSCTVFAEEYKNHVSNPTAQNDSWLAILNLMLAIGSRYSHLIRAEWKGIEGDHLIYFTRARFLGFNGDSVLGHAELQRVQVTGLMAFYLMSINQINRSWAISGIAIRYATTLGLNLRNDSAEVEDFSKEIRYRTWWALCFLERQLAVMTGRTPSFSDADCTCPQPLPVDESSVVDNQTLRRLSSHRSAHNESVISTPSPAHSYSKATSPADSESPSSQQAGRLESFPPSIGLYFFHLTKLSIFTNEVLSRLYRVVDMEKSWAETQSTMADLAKRLEKWRQALPLAFDFTKRIRDQQWIRQRKTLGFLYFSTMLIINRPCLCRIDRKIPNESGKAKHFNQATAAKCVHAAIDMLNLLPDEPNPVGMYTQSPWWSLVHHLVEAAVVCMLELSFRADHMPHEVDEVFESADKAVQWLRSMSSSNLAANRAWRMCDEMLRKVSPKVGKSVSDMLSSRQQAADPMQGLQSSHDQLNPFRPGVHGYQDLAPFQPPIFTTYDQMMSQDQILHNLLQSSTANNYPNMYPTTSGMETMSYETDTYFPDQDPNQQQWYLDGGGGIG